MELKNYKEGDEHRIIELFELVFKQKMTLEQWYWRFRQNPAGKHMIKLMWEGDLLVGHYAVSPVIMNVEDEDILTAHSLTTMTHPDYGGKGIFKTLSLALYEELENSIGCKAVWGYPNNNSHFGFIKSLGWSNISVIHTLGIDSSKIQVSDYPFEIKELDMFTSQHSEYLNLKVRSQFSVFVKRSVEYLNWRFVEKPAVSYKKYEIRHLEEIGIIVTKVYPSKKSGLFDLNIVECHLDNYSYLHNIIKYITEDYNLEFDRVTIWKNLFDKDHLQLEKVGFVPVTPQTYLGARIHENMPKSFNDYKNWSISMGDSDVF